MSSKPSIAIIGATGRMGGALALRLVKENYRLLLFARNVIRLNEMEEAFRKASPMADLDWVTCAAEASWEADIIIPAVPFSAQYEIAKKIQQVATQQIIISLSNPVQPNETDKSDAEKLQELLPHSKVVKAFNTIAAEELIALQKPADSFIASDDEEANEVVAALVKKIG